MKIVLVAEEAAGIQTLKLLHSTPHQVVAVLTSSKGAKHEFRGATVASVANRLGYPVWDAKLVKDSALADTLREMQIDILLNVHSLHIIHPDLLSAPTIGSFNLHPGPLPRYAGLHAPSWAICEGEHKHAVTLHWMEAEIDTGPIAYLAPFDIGERDTGLSVSAKCVRLGLPLIASLLQTATSTPKAIPRIAQDLTQRRYFGPQVAYNGRLSWTLPAKKLIDFSRACSYAPLPSPWGNPKTRLHDRELAIVQMTRTYEPCSAPPGSVGKDLHDAVSVATADEWVLIHRVQGDKGMQAAAEVLRQGQQLH